MPRTLLGTASNLATRVRVYLAEDAVEIDEIEGYSGTRKRVLFDEVLLVTLDRRRPIGSLLIWGAIALFFTSIGAFPLLVRRPVVIPPVVITILILGGPFWAGFLLNLALGVDHVTVFGKRSTGQIRFLLRKRRAREVFALLTSRVRDAQGAAVPAAQPPVPPAGDAGGTAAA
jgi:hypothetical protein